MKLYATVTSERASKGQGGNKHLNIDIYVEDRENPRFKLFVNNFEDGTRNIVLVDMQKPFPNDVYKQELEPEKGKKQKGKCPACGKATTANPPSTHCVPL